MLPLDHIVFNARDRMDEVVARFEALGFSVTPRGHHTLGSINHTIVFGAEYLELLGYPPGRPPEKRPELAAGRLGWMATVLRSADADHTRAALLDAGLAPRPVQTFSRPVETAGGARGDAAFRVTRLEPAAVPGTWMYFCQHLTPEWVWRAEWQSHPNGALAVAELVIGVADPAAAAAAYAACVGAPLTPAEGGRSVRLGEATLRLTHADDEGIAALVVQVGDLAALVRRFERAGVPMRVDAGRLQVAPDFLFGTKLQFIGQAR